LLTVRVVGGLLTVKKATTYHPPTNHAPARKRSRGRCSEDRLPHLCQSSPQQTMHQFQFFGSQRLIESDLIADPQADHRSLIRFVKMSSIFFFNLKSFNNLKKKV
jgi:hypothetical protein